MSSPLLFFPIRGKILGSTREKPLHFSGEMKAGKVFSFFVLG